METDFVAVVKVLANDETLDARHRDHALTGPWQDHRDCHIRPDLVLIYRKPDTRCCSWCDWVRIASWLIACHEADIVDLDLENYH